MASAQPIPSKEAIPSQVYYLKDHPGYNFSGTLQNEIPIKKNNFTQLSDSQYDSSKMIDRLSEAVNEISEGEEQSLVNSNSLIQSFYFLSQFDCTNYGEPDFLIEPDGSIAFEWESPNRNFSLIISFSGSVVLHYAAIFGEVGECHGKEVYDRKIIPKVIIEILKRII